MRSFGHREDLDAMQSQIDEIWKEARLTGFGRILRLALSGLLIAGTVVLFFLINEPYKSSPVVLFLLAALIVSGIYDIIKVQKRKLLWNDEGIKRVGIFGEGRLNLWDNLTYVERSMHDRATVLTFKGLWKIKVYWSYRAHKEITSLAKQKRKEGKSKRKKVEKPAVAPRTPQEPVFRSSQRQNAAQSETDAMETARDNAVVSLGSRTETQEKT